MEQDLGKTVREELNRLSERCDSPHPSRPYQHIFSHQSWTLPSLVSAPFAEVTGGIWIRKSVSRVQHLPQSPPATGELSWEELGETDHIRVLILDPGSFSDPLRGRLVAVSIDSPDAKISYEALSYLWGNSQETADVLHFPSGRMHLRENLAQALRHLRREKGPRRLWIDAICINQENLTERSHQITLMRTIFEKASQVLMWLGLATEHTALGFEILRHFLNLRSGRRIWPYRDLPRELIVRGLEDVLTRQYFTRIWIVQEGALAKRVVMICGEQEIGWTNTIPEVLPFIRSIKAATLMPQGEEDGLLEVDFECFLALLQTQLENGPDANLWHSRRRRADLLETMYSSRNRRAAVQLDKVFGVLGLVDEATAKKIRLDYSASTEDVFDHTGQVLLEETDEMCAELQATGVRNHQTRLSMNLPGATLSSWQDERADDSSRCNVESLVEGTCSQGLALFRSGNFDEAAELLQSAATMIRGQKWTSRAPRTVNDASGMEKDHGQHLPLAPEVPRTSILSLAGLRALRKPHTLLETSWSRARG